MPSFYHCESQIQQGFAGAGTSSSYNDNFNLSNDDVRLNLAVAEDVAEEIIMKRNRGKSPDSFDGDDE